MVTMIIIIFLGRHILPTAMPLLFAAIKFYHPTDAYKFRPVRVAYLCGRVRDSGTACRMRNMLNTFSGLPCSRCLVRTGTPLEEEAWTARTTNKSNSISFWAQKRAALAEIECKRMPATDGSTDIKFNLGSSFAAASLFAVSFAFAN